MLTKLRDSSWTTAQTSGSLPRHRWYVIKEGFAASLVETAVRETGCEGTDRIIDPFCGSGTVPVTAARHRHRVLGVEVNPFLSFVSRTKLAQCAPEKVKDNLGSVLRAVKRGAPSPLESISTFSEKKSATKWLFNREVLRAFEGGWRATNELNRPSKQLLRLCLIGAAMDSCNGFQDGKCLRYRKDWQKLAFGPEEFQEFLQGRIDCIVDDLRTDPIDSSLAKIISGDARHVLKTPNLKKFQLCITSPPYLNSFDYTDVYRPELFLSRTIQSPKALHEHRLHTLRSHIQVKWPDPTHSDFGPLYDECQNEIHQKQDALWDKRLPLMIQAYFEDLKGVLRGLRRCAAPSARLWLIVSTSAYAGVEIPVDLITAHLGEKAGWSLKELAVIRRLRPSGQHTNSLSGITVQVPRLRESVVVFEARGDKNHPGR